MLQFDYITSVITIIQEYLKMLFGYNVSMQETECLRLSLSNLSLLKVLIISNKYSPRMVNSLPTCKSLLGIQLHQVADEIFGRI